MTQQRKGRPLWGKQMTEESEMWVMWEGPEHPSPPTQYHCHGAKVPRETPAWLTDTDALRTILCYHQDGQ